MKTVLTNGIDLAGAISIETFKTDITDVVDVEKVCAVLSNYFPCSRVTVDTEDCDRVLRIAGAGLESEQIIHLLNNEGYLCEPLL